MLWGRRILVMGTIMALVSATPALLMLLFPPLGEGFLGTVAILLTITVAPLGVVLMGVGLVLMLIGALRRVRAAPATARAASPPTQPRQ